MESAPYYFIIDFEIKKTNNQKLSYLAQYVINSKYNINQVNIDHYDFRLSNDDKFIMGLVNPIWISAI